MRKKKREEGGRLSELVEKTDDNDNDNERLKDNDDDA